MAKMASRMPTQSAVVTKAPTHRMFKDRPSGVYIDEFGKHVKETGEPETYPGLYQDKIPRDAEFKLLRKFSIDREKRPKRDMAFCPRCGQEDKYIHGDLAWFPKLQICAAIGHCCASHEARADAEREFKWREKRRYEEDYLLAAFPHVAARRALLMQMRRDCEEALRVYRQFRKDAQPLQTALRRLKEQYGGHLVVTTVIRGLDDALDDAEAEKYDGPAGFRGRGRNQVETRDTDLGLMSGLIALHRDFNPVKELEFIERQLASFDSTPEGEGMLEYIIGMSDRQRNVAVVILETADKKFWQLAQRLDEFWLFFSPDNLAAIRRYADHPDSVIYADIKRQTEGGRTVVRFSNRNFLCRLSYPNPRGFSELAWPTTVLTGGA